MYEQRGAHLYLGFVCQRAALGWYWLANCKRWKPVVNDPSWLLSGTAPILLHGPPLPARVRVFGVRQDRGPSWNTLTPPSVRTSWRIGSVRVNLNSLRVAQGSTGATWRF